MRGEELGVQAADGGGVGVGVAAEEQHPPLGVGGDVGAQVGEHLRGDRGDEGAVVGAEHGVGARDRVLLGGVGELVEPVERVEVGREFPALRGAQAGRRAPTPRAVVDAAAGVAGSSAAANQVLNAG